MKNILAAVMVASAATLSTLPIAFAIPYCQPCPYDCDSIGNGLGKKDCSEVSDDGDTCCVDLTEWGLQLAQAESAAGGHTAEDEDDDEECPDGFEESEDKCTPEEREEGCKDIRLDNGKGCVSR